MTAAEITRAIDLRQQGWTFRRIGRELHYHAWTVARRLRPLLGRTSVRSVGRARAQRAAALRMQGWRWVRIAPHLGYASPQAARSAAAPYLPAETADRSKRTWCSGCERWLPHTAFGVDRHRTSRRAWQCKNCTVERSRIRRRIRHLGEREGAA